MHNKCVGRRFTTKNGHKVTIDMQEENTSYVYSSDYLCMQYDRKYTKAWKCNYLPFEKIMTD